MIEWTPELCEKAHHWALQNGLLFGSRISGEGVVVSATFSGGIEPTQAELEAYVIPAAVKIWPDAERFMAEFSLEEMAAISLSTQPTIAALRFMLSTWLSPVHADDARVIMGLDALEAEGVISTERRAQIIALPTTV